ncbi:MAG TPA: hypothetical protein VMG82_36415 [Candidatus Sulfotelmatobacter sp.]|nr:hypothetical protein [Candidatus Sulfotelmatobacter sp.]
MSALDALGDFHFAFAREQRNCSHLAQVHADGVVGFFQCAGRQVKLDVLALFQIFKPFLVEPMRRQLGSFQDVDALRTNCSQQIVKVFGTVHVMRYEVVDLVIREISLFFSCVDQLFYVVELIV